VSLQVIARLALVGVSAVALVAFLAIAVFNLPYFREDRILGLVQISFVLFTSVLSLLSFRSMDRSPTTLSVSLIGLPNSGKTVYLTVLFDTLMTSSQGRKANALRFAPYGYETLEEVTENVELLKRNIWLSRTGPAEIFPFRATATLGRGLTRRRYKVEIRDFAGEHTEELLAESRWLHKSHYFRTVVESDAVLLALDCEEVLRREERDPSLDGIFVTAVQALIADKGVAADERLRAPVALLFMKADLILSRAELQNRTLTGTTLEALTQRLPRLVSLCQDRCSSFRSFLVSSVGEVGPNGEPPRTLRPVGVVEPVAWIFSRVRRL
jgi:hypothetical protein